MTLLQRDRFGERVRRNQEGIGDRGHSSDAIGQLHPDAKGHRGTVGETASIDARLVHRIGARHLVDQQAQKTHIVDSAPRRRRAGVLARIPGARVVHQVRTAGGVFRRCVGRDDDEARSIGFRDPSALFEHVRPAPAEAVEHDHQRQRARPRRTVRHMQDVCALRSGE
jgi:hypothetical protein